MNKNLIAFFIAGILLVGSFLVLYNQKPENVSISEFLSNKLGGITGFAVITHNTSTNWTGTFVNTTITGENVTFNNSNFGIYSGTHFDTSVNGSDSPRSIVAYNNFLYLVDYTDAEVYKYSLDGVYVSSFDTAESGATTPYGITAYGDSFWVSDITTNEIYKYNSAGTYISKFATGISARGLDDYNDFLWITNSGSTIYKFYFNGTYTGTSFNTVAANDAAIGIAAADGFFWITDNTDAKVYKYYTNGTYTGINFATTGTTDPWGITYYNNSLWINSRADAEVYKYNQIYYPSGTYTSQVIDAGASVQWNNLSWTMINGSNYNVSFQVASCNDASCSGEILVGPSNTSTTYFTSSPVILNDTLTPNNQYFQYKTFFLTGNTSLTPHLASVSLDYTVPDQEYPIFTNLAVNVTNGSAYASGLYYRFNATITSTNASGGLEFNSVNYSLSNISTNFYADVGDLSAGTYPYYFWAYGNGSNYYYNTTTTSYYNIANATPTGTLIFNETSPITFGTSLNVTLLETNTEDGDVTYEIFRDNVSVGIEDTGLLGAGTYHYILNTSGGANYSANSSLDEEIFVVNQKGDPFTYLLNGATNDLTITYPQEINATLLNNLTTSTILLNGTTLTSGTNYTIGAGVWTLNYSVIGNQNYTANETSLLLTINPSSDNCNILFNETSPITYPKQFLVYTDCSGDFVLTRNGTTISNASTESLEAGNYNYSIHRNDTQNYSNTVDEELFTISQASQSIIPLLNGASSNLEITYPQQINASFSGNNYTSVLIDINGTTLTSGTNYTWGVGGWLVNYSLRSNQNYSGTDYLLNLTVNTQSQTATLSINETSPVIYGININATCNGELYREDANITSEIGTAVLLGAGNWDYSCKLYSDGQNITYDDDNSTFVVNQQGNPLSVLLNGVAANLTVTYPTQVNVSFSGNQTTATIDVNGTTFTNGANHSLGIGVWFVNVSAVSNQNYTYNETHWYITVNSISSGDICTLDTDCSSNSCKLSSNEITKYCAVAGKECGQNGGEGYDTGDVDNNNICQLDGTWLCSAGYYTNASCTAVGQGYYSSSSNDTRTQCSAGYYGNSTINSLSTCDGLCSENYYCLAGSTNNTANACPAGFSSPAGANHSSWCVAISNFNGDTTNLNNIDNIDNVSGMIVENTTCGKIKWNNAVNASSADINAYIQMGDGWVYIDTPNLDTSFNTSANVSIYNLNLGYPRILKDGVTCSDCAILSWDTDTGNVEFSVNSFSNYTAEESNQSKIQNYGLNNASVYVLLKIQYWNAGAWVDDDIIYNDSTPYTLYDNGSYVKLDSLWNGKWNTAYNASYGMGVYRAYAAITSLNGTILTKFDGTSMEASYNFTYNVSDAEYPLFTNLAVNVTNNTVYSSGLNYRFNTTIINTNGSGGLEFNAVNYTLSSISSHFYSTVGSLTAGTYPYYFWAYGNGTLARYNTTITNYYTVATVPVTPVTPPPSGGGGGGGGGIAPVNFDLEKYTYETTVSLDSTEHTVIKLTNNEKLQKTFKIEKNNLDGIIFLDKDSITLDGKKSADIEFTINAPDEAGVYTGKILVSSGSTTKSVLVVVNVKTAKNLFDIGVTIPQGFKSIKPGQNLKAQINLLQAGLKENMDITLNYIVKDFDGIVHYAESETIMIYDQKSLEKDLHIGTLPLGNYVLGVELIYSDGVAVASSQFKVSEGFKLTRNNIILLILVGVIIILIITTLLIIKKYKRGRRFKRIALKKKR